MMQALTPEQQQQLREQQLLHLYGDPGLGKWTPAAPHAAYGPPLTPAELEWLRTLRQNYCPESEVFQEALNAMRTPRDGLEPENLKLDLMRIEEEVRNKMEPCDKSHIFPRGASNVKPPPPPRQDPQGPMAPAPIWLPQPMPPPAPQPVNPFALNRQPGTIRPSGASAQPRLRAVLLAGQAQRQREQAATGKLVTVYGTTRHAAMIMANIHPVDVRSGEPDHLYDISYVLDDGILADDELDRFLKSLQLNMRMRGYKTCRWRALAHSVLFVVGANGVADKKVLKKILEAHAMDPNGPRLLLSK